MRVGIDTDRCRGHGICTVLCPDIFELSEDGYAQTRVPEVPDGAADDVRTTAEACPERAISVSE
ncbi:ferredoxin [Nocardia goodfellowii]